MKGAAKCDNHCELQNSVNQLELERTLRFWDIPESMLTSVTSTTIFSLIFPPQVGRSAEHACVSGVRALTY